MRRTFLDLARHTEPALGLCFERNDDRNSGGIRKKFQAPGNSRNLHRRGHRRGGGLRGLEGLLLQGQQVGLGLERRDLGGCGVEGGLAIREGLVGGGFRGGGLVELGLAGRGEGGGGLRGGSGIGESLGRGRLVTRRLRGGGLGGGEGLGGGLQLRLGRLDHRRGGRFRRGDVGERRLGSGLLGRGGGDSSGQLARTFGLLGDLGGGLVDGRRGGRGLQRRHGVGQDLVL